ncbi:DUF1360 domain-containing protein [Streptomyces griseus]|uniref:DUF1360 domain-containing protein n=1 Tax=Streptomyces griseus TaxID=1911 RepID=UPI000A3AC451|nr:DUF1360 domain-containing protein [Streptomyces fimicarius]
MLTLVELAVLAAAGYRGTQLLVHDSILDPARDRIEGWFQKKPESKARELVVTLISCVYCTGWWVSGAVLATYLLAAGRWHDAPLLIHGLEWLAVAGAAVAINRWDDSLKGH